LKGKVFFKKRLYFLLSFKTNFMSKKIFQLLVIPVAALMLSVLIPSCKGKASDADVKSSIDKAFSTNPDLSPVMVDVKDGTATLNGEVKDGTAKSEAETTAKSVKGVTAVVNNLTYNTCPGTGCYYS
jgi:hypothetical protein